MKVYFILWVKNNPVVFSKEGIVSVDLTFIVPIMPKDGTQAQIETTNEASRRCLYLWHSAGTC